MSSCLSNLQLYPRIYVEIWEPIAPTIIRTKYHLIDYSVALLRHFGAQQVHVDLPWRILTSLLPKNADWPEDSVELMHLVHYAIDISAKKKINNK